MENIPQENIPVSLPLPRRIWWRWDQSVEKVAFTREFSIISTVEATFYISSSGSCHIWLDGTAVVLPPSTLPNWRIMQTTTITLTSGNHRFCIDAVPGDPGQPYLLACLDWQVDGQQSRLPTDSTWQMAANPMPGWQEHPLDGDWHTAWAFDGVWAEPWGMPCNAPDDFCRMGSGWQTMTREKLTHIVNLYQGSPALGSAARLLGSGMIEMQPPLPYPTQPPQIKSIRPGLEWYRIRENHSIVSNLWLELFSVRNPHIVFDAGSETFARLKIRLRSGGPAIIAVSTGESLQEVHKYNRRVTDVFELKDSEFFTTAPTGFRYIKMTVLSGNSNPVLIDPIEIQHIRYPVEPVGQFTCSDELLNQVWQVSARTVHLCMQNEIWDGIKRDQLPWMGDLYTEALAIYHAFGDYRLARRSLAVLAEIGPVTSRPLEAQQYPGLNAIWKIPGGDINNIPSYTLWWLAGLADYVLYSGDLSLVRELKAELIEILDHIASWVGDDGLWRFRGGWDYVDWAPLTATEREFYCHLLACQVLELGAGLLESINQPGTIYHTLHEKMVKATRSTWWQNGTGSFGTSHHFNAMAMRSGVLSADEAQTLFNRNLAPDPPASMTYWHRFLDLNAAAKANNVQWGLDYIRRHWGLSLQLGVTTFWEAFDPAWIGDDPHAVSMIGAGYARYGGYETSLCHGWSAGPVAWLHTAVLGVTPLSPGFLTISFTPDLGDLAWAEGSVPSPQGTIHVNLQKSVDNQSIATLIVPKGIEVIIPQTIKDSWQIEINIHANS